MALKGDLSTIGLGEVFQMISMSQKEGTLVVQDGESRKAIYFGKEGVQLLSTGRRKGFRIGDILVRAGKISQEKLKEVLDRQKTSKRLLGEELVNSGHVTRKDIQDVVRAQIEEEIYDLFLWKRAAFEFIEGAPVEELRDPDSHVIRLSFDLNMLLLEAVRRTDEWTRINMRIPSMDCVFQFENPETRHQEIASGTAEAKMVLERIDGRTSIHDILEMTLRPRFEVCHLIMELMERGSVRLVEVSEMVEGARQLLAEGDQDRGLRLYNAAALMDPDDVDIMSGFAHALETQGLLQDAARVYVRIGSQLESSGRAQEGVAYFQRAVALVPNDPQSKIALFGVSLAGGNLEEAMQTARDLVVSSLAAKDYDTARTVAEKGVAAAPQDLGMRVALAKAYHGLGLTSLRDDVVKYLHKNLPVDQGESGRIVAELQGLTAPGPMTKAIRMAAAKRRHRKRVVLPAGVVLGVLAAAWIAFEVMAATAFSRRSIEARSMEDRGQVADAKAHIREFGESIYRFSLVSGSKGTQYLEEMEDRQRPPAPPPPPPAVTDPGKIEEIRLAAEKKRNEAKLAELELSIKQLADLGDMAGALAATRALGKLADKLKDQKRKDFAVANEETIRRYEDSARDLKEDAARLEKEGRFKEAAEKVAELFRVYQFSSAAKAVTYPLVLRLARPGVEILRDGRPVETTKGKDVILRLKKDDKPFQLSFVKKGFRERKIDVQSLTVGLIDVRMDERVADWQFPLGAALAAPPIVDGDAIYVRTRERVLGIALEDRKVRWSVKLEIVPSCAMKLVGGLLYAASAKGVTVIDPAKPDGQNVVRTMAVDAPIIGALGLSDSKEVLYFGTGGGGFVAMHAQTGATVWKRTFPREVVAEPVEHQGSVLVACRDGILYAVRGAELGDPDANLAWKSPPVGDMDAAPLVHDGVGYVGTGSGKLTAIDLSSGKPLWTAPVESPVTGRAALAAGRLCVPTLAGALVAVDRGTHEAAWKYPTEGPVRTSPVNGNGFMLIGSEDKWLHAVSD
ncbi:MAG TPA: PQQ-binding-like beta-propeller repeat protein, partial [Planctomycetota bacterium]|nr:PQQ-binding-like beta-propeller repeat protein [Planctomycetota bacterium]